VNFVGSRFYLVYAAMSKMELNTRKKAILALILVAGSELKISVLRR
jgi:hypothetical protein